MSARTPEPGRAAAFLSVFRAGQLASNGREIARAATGAGLGIAATAGISTALAGASGGAPLLIAPLGASAVLLFAVPASPLAQPYAMLAGNVLAALVGVTAAMLIPAPLVAAPVAVVVALAAMALCRCVHPPSGAVALVAVLGGPHILAQGYRFVAVPVLLNSALLIASAIGWNRLTGRAYPHDPDPAPTPATHRAAPSLADLEAVLAEHGDGLAIDAAELKSLYEALSRRMGAAY